MEEKVNQDNIICRCEEVSEREIREAIINGCRTITEVKRWTRAGMGICQGLTCTRLVERILCETQGLSPDKLEKRSVRQPLRPVSLSSLE